MAESKEIEKKDVFEVIDEARDKACAALGNLEALVNLCKDSAAFQSARNEVDILGIISIVGDLTAEALEGLGRIEETVRDAENLREGVESRRERIEELFREAVEKKRTRPKIVEDTFIDLETARVYKAEDDYERTVLRELQEDIERAEATAKGLLEAHRAKTKDTKSSEKEDTER